MSRTSESLLEELEALTAIMMEQIVVVRNESGSPVAVEILLFPSTGDDTRSQYVRVTLVVSFVPGYPDVAPEVRLKNPRGLDDTLISELEKSIKSKCLQCLGEPVVYELIQLVQEHLTKSNIPSCDCAVCLYSFSENDVFTKSDCYHYFHSYCLGCHMKNMERIFHEEQEKLPAWQRQKEPYQVPCPVCREPLTCNIEELITAPQPIDLECAKDFSKSEDLCRWQEDMKLLLQKQKEKGGVIDAASKATKLILLTEQDEGNPRDEERNDPVDNCIESSTDDGGGVESLQALRMNSSSWRRDSHRHHSSRSRRPHFQHRKFR